MRLRRAIYGGDLDADIDSHDPGPPDFSPSREAAVDYMMQMAGELAGMARQVDLPLLAYVFDMARLEALRSETTEVRPARPRSRDRT